MKQFNVRISEAAKERIERICEQRGLTQGQWVESAAEKEEKMSKHLHQEDIELMEKEHGLYSPRVLHVERDYHGYPNLLVEAEDHSGYKFRGWLLEGESVGDVEWTPKSVDGWRWDGRGRWLGNPEASQIFYFEHWDSARSAASRSPLPLWEHGPTRTYILAAEWDLIASFQEAGDEAALEEYTEVPRGKYE